MQHFWTARLVGVTDPPPKISSRTKCVRWREPHVMRPINFTSFEAFLISSGLKEAPPVELRNLADISCVWVLFEPCAKIFLSWFSWYIWIFKLKLVKRVTERTFKFICLRNSVDISLFLEEFSQKFSAKWLNKNLRHRLIQSAATVTRTCVWGRNTRKRCGWPRQYPRPVHHRSSWMASCGVHMLLELAPKNSVPWAASDGQCFVVVRRDKCVNSVMKWARPYFPFPWTTANAPFWIREQLDCLHAGIVRCHNFQSFRAVYIILFSFPALSLLPPPVSSCWCAHLHASVQRCLSSSVGAHED